MNKQQLASKIWASANKMCSKIEANEYKAFYNNEEATTLNAVRKELYGSFAHFSTEDQKYAGIFLNDIQQGRISRDNIDPDKSLSDYIQDYRAAAKNDQIHRFSEAVGIDEDKLRNIISLHLPDTLLNQGGHYDELFRTLDKTKAKQFLESVNGGAMALPFQISAKADRLIRDFISKGGFDIDEL